MENSTKYNDLQSKENSAYMRKRILLISMGIAGIVLLIFLLSTKTNNHMQSSNSGPKFKKQGELTLTKSNGSSIVTIDIEIADNDSKREVGMMDRTTMDEKQGMLFVFDEEYRGAFWMRNTILSLDIIFINQQGEIITIHKNTKPLSDDTYAPSGIAWYVLEVNAGFSETYGLKEGDRMSWKRLE